MKKGDLVQAKYSFKIIEIREHSMVCAFNVNNNVEYQILPIYIEAFGIRFREQSFTKPGDLDNKFHPDYYKFLHMQDSKAIWLDRFGRQVFLELSTDFNFTGEYKVITVNKNTSLTKYAKKLTEEEFQSQLAAMATNNVIPGKFIVGRVLGFAYAAAGSTHIEEDRFEITDSLEEAIGRNAHDNPKFPVPTVIIQDQATYIEFDLPHHLVINYGDN